MGLRVEEFRGVCGFRFRVSRGSPSKAHGVLLEVADIGLNVQGVKVLCTKKAAILLCPNPLTLGITRAQKPYIAWSLGPKALIYESLDP